MRWVFVFALLLFCVADPLIFPEETQHSGFIPVSPAQPAYAIFYWFFRSRTHSVSAPLIIFMRGGPGCAGTTAALGETGPFMINPDLSLTLRPYSINNFADVLFVDQPLGTGFSNCSDKSRIPKDEAEVSEDMLTFYRGFVEKFSDVKFKPVYFLGLSYAGHFIPAVALKFLQVGINVRGAAINNGWYDPTIQIRMRGVYTRTHGLVDLWEAISGAVLESLEILAVKLAWPTLAERLDELVTGYYQGFEHKKFNAYDIRLPCPDPLIESGCYNDTLITKFMAREDFRKALNVGDRNFSDCNEEIEEIMVADNYADITPTVIELLDKYSLKMIIYAGEYDWMCDVLGQNAWIEGLAWKYRKELGEEAWHEWYINGKAMGRYKKHANLMQGIVYNAGHAIVADQPEVMNDAIFRLIRSEEW